MALRQVIPEFQPALSLGTGDMKPFKRMQPPVKTGFRANANIRELLGTIRDNTSVVVDGAVACGKSTVIPQEIVKAFEVLLVHVVPTDHLRVALVHYLRSRGQVVHTTDDVTSPWPRTGVVIVTASCIFARMMSEGRLSLPKCWIYHDECHTADAYTFLLKNAWGSIVGVEKYIATSATLGASGYRAMEERGHVDVRRVPMPPTATWRVFDNRGFPWEVSNLRGNTLIFEDDVASAKHLVSEYSRAGFDVYRLHSRMSPDSFLDVLARMRDRRAGVAVLIADSTFRDGHTFSLTDILDPGVVVTTEVDGEVPARCARPAYAFERYQAAHRGGRVAGEHVRVWQSTSEAPATLSVLESVEGEAAALVSRLLGRLHPIEVTDAVMADGPVPSRLCESLRGCMPLALLKGSQLTTIGAEGYRRPKSPMLAGGEDPHRSGVDYTHRVFSADQARSQRAYLREGATSADARAFVEPSLDAQAECVSSRLGEMSLEHDEEVPVITGNYYYCSSVPLNVVTSTMFPDGHRGVLRFRGDGDTDYRIHGLPRDDIAAALSILLRRFNTLSAELNGVALAAGESGYTVTGRSRTEIRQWMTEHAEHCVSTQAECNVIAGAILAFSRGRHRIECLDSRIFKDLEQRHAAKIASGLRSVIRPEVAPAAIAEHYKNRGFVMPARAQPVVVPPAIAERPLQSRRAAVTASGSGKPEAPLTPFARYMIGYHTNKHIRKKVDSVPLGESPDK